MTTKNYILRHNDLKDAIIESIKQKALQQENGTLIINEPLELAYSSDLNGWCYDFLGAVTADGDAFFIEEDSSFSEDGIVAEMSLDDIMLDSLLELMGRINIGENLIVDTRALIDEVDDLIENIRGSVPFSAEFNYADSELFWRMARENHTHHARKDSILTSSGKIPWKRIPIDDKCIIMDAIHRNL